jgi:hypothetical protein
MNVGEIIGGGLVILVCALFLTYGFKFGSIMLLTRGDGGGMKDRVKEPFGFWGAVVEWSVFLCLGVFAVIVGIFPPLDR